MSVNVGLSRKASRDYQSTGVSINVTAELDSALLAKPAELQQQVDQLYRQAQEALDRQVSHVAAATPAPRTTAGPRPRTTPNGNGHANGNGHTNGRSTGGGMTASQRKAILAIAERLGVDASQEAYDLLGTELDDLAIRQASELIDHLKGMTPAGRNGNGHH